MSSPGASGSRSASRGPPARILRLPQPPPPAGGWGAEWTREVTRSAREPGGRDRGRPADLGGIDASPVPAGRSNRKFLLRGSALAEAVSSLPSSRPSASLTRVACHPFSPRPRRSTASCLPYGVSRAREFASLPVSAARPILHTRLHRLVPLSSKDSCPPSFSVEPRTSQSPQPLLGPGKPWIPLTPWT